MNDQNQGRIAVNVPAEACSAVQDMLAKALPKLAPGMESAASVFKALYDVLAYLGCSMVDGGDRTITISVRHLDADEVSIIVDSTFHLPPEADVGVHH